MLKVFFGPNGFHWDLFQPHNYDWSSEFITRVTKHITAHPNGLIARHAELWKPETTSSTL